MIFSIVNNGSVDIAVNDYVHVSLSCLDPAPVGIESDSYFKVVSVSGSNTKQVQIRYVDPFGVVSNIWIDTVWIDVVLRPQVIS